MKFLIFIFTIGSIYAQTKQSHNGQDFQYGIGVKFGFEIQKFSNFRFSIAGGIGKPIDDVEFIYPSLHCELQIYNGGIGSTLLYSKHRNLVFDFNTSVTVTAGIRGLDEFSSLKKFTPLYYFSDLNFTPLQAPYYNSFSLGSNFIVSSDSERENQLVGFSNLNLERTVQICYYNDGTPWGNFTGDGYDRYFTGGGVLSYHSNFSNSINLVELSYHKFTGYQRFAFEIANHMQIDFIPYKSVNAFYYNQSRWRLKAANFESGFGFQFSVYDKQKWDMQDLIHFTIDNGYHPDTYHETRYSFGLDYSYINFNSK